jgi:hypothetical protein
MTNESLIPTNLRACLQNANAAVLKTWITKLIHQPGLPDFFKVQLTEIGKIYQMATKYIPKGH